MPRRLLDLGPDQLSLMPKLCLTKHMTSIPTYTTLSHCWGNKVPLRLTKGTLNKFVTGIPMSALPQKFIEAMLCTKRLCLRYIWIDCLCIIQDCEDDWRLEASQMKTIYERAYCNIAAASTPTIEGGLFGTRSPLDLKNVVIRPPWATSNYFCSDDELWHGNISQSPLLKRGWVLQEILLAPRVLYFGEKQMFWECASLQACESWPGGIPKMLNQSHTKLALITEAAMEVEPLTELRSEELERIRNRRGGNGLPVIGGCRLEPGKDQDYLHLWPEIVTRYSKTTLTYPERDKLVALSGVAKLISSPDNYLAGLWIPQLPHSLAWRSISPTPRPSTYQAPTWSWASINTGVIFASELLADSLFIPSEGAENEGADIERADIEKVDNERADPTIVKAKMSYANDDRTGQVKNGYIRLKGFMARGLVEKSWTETAYIYSSHPENVSACQVGPAILHVFPDETPILDGATLFCFYIGGNYALDRVFGILLEKYGVRRGVYRRVGYFEVVRSTIPKEGPSKGRENADAFIALWRESLKRKPWDYIRWTENAVTVTIV